MAAASEDADHARQLRKAVIASTVGATIEWYDFFLYGTAAGLVFGKLFFPNYDPLAATFLAFGTYFVGFVARPIGAAIFGHYGDRIGRKTTLIATLLCMGIATFLVAFVPTYESIGIWGAVILTVLRAIQGIGVGGQWGGSVLVAMEWSKSHGRRGLIASWPQLGVPLGLFLGNLLMLMFSDISGDQFLTWGWRVPFGFSILLVGVGLWIRLGILETPVFQQLRASNRIEKTPILQVLRMQPRQVLLSALLRMSEQAPFYIFSTFVFAYTTGTLGMPRGLALGGVMAGAALGFVIVPLSGHLSDRFGRRKVFMTGAGLTGLFGFAYFAALGSAVPAVAFGAIMLSLVCTNIQYAVEAALIAEAFTPRLRYSGASLGYQLASLIAGGPAPIIATALLATYHSGYAVAVYIAVCAVIGLSAAALMPDHTGKDISAEYDEAAKAMSEA